jgi:hypothetical protein
VASIEEAAAGGGLLWLFWSSSPLLIAAVRKQAHFTFPIYLSLAVV